MVNISKYSENVMRRSQNLPAGLLYAASAVMGLLAGAKIIGMLRAGPAIGASEIEPGKQIIYALSFLVIAGFLYRKARRSRAQEVVKNNWQRAYCDLSQVMASAGVADACGKGDYWILDDWYGGVEQKICIFNINILTSALIAEIRQKLLWAEDYKIWVQLELSDSRYTGGASGMVIVPSGITEDWDKEKLKSELNWEFR